MFIYKIYIGTYFLGVEALQIGHGYACWMSDKVSTTSINVHGVTKKLLNRYLLTTWKLKKDLGYILIMGQVELLC